MKSDCWWSGDVALEVLDDMFFNNAYFWLLFYIFYVKLILIQKALAMQMNWQCKW